jgi:hypothetical protein
VRLKSNNKGRIELIIELFIIFKPICSCIYRRRQNKQVVKKMVFCFSIINYISFPQQWLRNLSYSFGRSQNIITLLFRLGSYFNYCVDIEGATGCKTKTAKKSIVNGRISARIDCLQRRGHLQSCIPK